MIKMKKRDVILITLSILIVLILPLISAGFFDDVWEKITGKVTSDTTALNITVGNSAPTITWVESIPATNPTDDTTTSITFNFTATDTDGEGNLDDSTASAYFQKGGETTRTNTSCITAGTGSGNNQNYTCTIDLWYYDGSGAWTINVTIQDINNADGENSSTTFTYNLLLAMKM
ncbi:MAG: hypothetical protein QQN41_13750, partial [Nitrosopumilus sp.]